MATIVGAVGTSHSPMLLSRPELWLERADQDRSNPELYDSTGQLRTWAELNEMNGDKYQSQISLEIWRQRHSDCLKATNRLAADLTLEAPDVLVVIGDDQSEIFDDSVQPVMSVFWGEHWATDTLHNAPQGEFFNSVASGYAMDYRYEFDGHPQLGNDIISGLVHKGFDIASMARTPIGRGFGHAYGYVIRRLLSGRQIPVIPVLLNTYYPPNQPSATRCFDFGVALRESIVESSFGGTVVLVASGGLTHFVVDEVLDRQLLQSLSSNDVEGIRSIPNSLLQGGSSEIRNWIVIGGAMSDRGGLKWHEYIPCYRSTAGTGCGMAFARW